MTSRAELERMAQRQRDLAVSQAARLSVALTEGRLSHARAHLSRCGLHLEAAATFTLKAVEAGDET